MKNKIFQLSIFILLILAYIYHRELFITQQKLTLLLMKNITYALKNKKVIYYIFFIAIHVYLFNILANISVPPVDAFIENAIARPVPIIKVPHKTAKAKLVVNA